MKKNAGVTVLELLIAISVGAIIVFCAGRLYVTFVENNHSMKKVMLVRQHFAYANTFLEKDIRMAGLNLPSKGIFFDIQNPHDHSMNILQNEQNLRTRLVVEGTVGGSRIFVASASGVSSLDWVCLCKDGVDTVFYQISYVGSSAGENDTISIGEQTLADTWTTDSTDVYFATSTTYSMRGSDAGTESEERSLVRWTRQGEYKIGRDIKKIIIIPKDLDGTVLTSDFNRVRSVCVQLSRPSSYNPEKSLMSEIEANIRNF